MTNSEKNGAVAAEIEKLRAEIEDSSSDAPVRPSLSEWLSAETAKADGALRLDCTVEELSSPFGVAFLRAHLSPAAMDCLCHPDSRLVSSYNHTYARFGGFGWGDNGRGAHRYRDILTALEGRFTPREKAFAWLHYVLDCGVMRHLCAWVESKAPGFEDYQNLHRNCFYSLSHPESARNSQSGRSAVRKRLEPYLQGDAPEEVFYFLEKAAKDDEAFPARQMFLYACAHCRSLGRFRNVLRILKGKLGSFDIVDSLGYSPFFYTALRTDSIFQPLANADPGCGAPKVRMEDFLRALEDAGARPDRPCRYGFSWRDLEAVAAEFRREREERSVGLRNLSDSPFQTVAFPDSYAPTTGADIPALLASSPEKGIAALLRMDFEPESLEVPIGPRERILADAVCDADLPAATRAGLLLAADSRPFRSVPLGGASCEVPPGLLDSSEGRKWYCAKRKPGWEDVLCSDSTFFMSERFGEYQWKSVKIAPNVRKAIDADSPAQLMMHLSVAGKNVDRRILYIILNLHKTKILDWLMENDEKTRMFLTPRRMLFYVCANWIRHSVEGKVVEDAVPWLETAEAKEPGILTSCVDFLGRNLLWYTLYNRGGDQIDDTLLKHGCDPDARTAFGLTWREMKDAKEAIWKSGTLGASLRGFDEASGGGIFINGRPAREAIPNYGKDCPKLDSVKIVLHDGAAMEWKWTGTGDRYFRDVTGVNEGVGFMLELNRTKKYSDSFGRAYAVFLKGPDGLYRFTGMQEE